MVMLLAFMGFSRQELEEVSFSLFMSVYIVYIYNFTLTDPIPISFFLSVYSCLPPQIKYPSSLSPFYRYTLPPSLIYRYHSSQAYICRSPFLFLSLSCFISLKLLSSLSILAECLYPYLSSPLLAISPSISSYLPVFFFFLISPTLLSLFFYH